MQTSVILFFIGIFICICMVALTHMNKKEKHTDEEMELIKRT
jgi:hypothetical protein